MRIGIKASAPPDSAPYTFRIRPVNEGQLCAARALPKNRTIRWKGTVPKMTLQQFKIQIILSRGAL